MQSVVVHGAPIFYGSGKEKIMSDCYYAVRRGHQPGIYRTWEEAKPQVSGYPDASYRKFKEHADAIYYVKYGKIPEKDNQQRNTKIIYTDGACTKNGQDGAKGGIGVYFGNKDPRNLSMPLPKGKPGTDWERPTNQLAELYAISKAMEICLADQELRKRRIIIATDSMYAYNCLKLWIPSWKKNGWIKSDNRPVKHSTLLKIMDHQRQQLNVEFMHVRGHSGMHGNDMADQLAVAGALQYQL
jgi:ribonuclease HI